MRSFTCLSLTISLVAAVGISPERSTSAKFQTKASQNLQKHGTPVITGIATHVRGSFRLAVNY
jgi:hypothetical protein